MFPSIAISIVIFLLAQGTYSFVYKKYSNSYRTYFNMRSHVVQNQQNFKTMYTVIFPESNFQFQPQCFVQVPEREDKSIFLGGGEIDGQ